MEEQENILRRGLGSDEFMDRVVSDLHGAMITLLCQLGDRLGLFRELIKAGALTSSMLAQRAGVNERYTQEWLDALFYAGYLNYSYESQLWSVPSALATILCDDGPVAIGGVYQWFCAIDRVLDHTIDAFRSGAGVQPDIYHPDLWEGMHRVSNANTSRHLIDHWLAELPNILALLEQGITVADIGCGQGGVILNLAKAFPRSSFVGYDMVPVNIERAQDRARKEKVMDRVHFICSDACDQLAHKYDLILSLDVLHDAANPLALLKSLWTGLKSGGVCLCLESNHPGDSDLYPNRQRAYILGTSIFYCLSQSLAQGGAGFGALGLTEDRLRVLSEAAGFLQIQRVPITTPGNALYILTKSC